MRSALEAGPVERLAADRRLFERVVLHRFGSTLTAEDAEDVVSEALLASAARCPDGARDGGRSWFTRVVLNRAEDYRRARDGRPRAARKGGNRDGAGTSRRFVPLDALEVGLLPSDEHGVGEQLEQRIARQDTQSTVRKALATLAPDHVAVLRLRHVGRRGQRISRRLIAEELGISLWQYESLYTSACRAFARAVSEAAPTEQCATTRELLSDSHERSNTRRFADAHVAACCSCAAFGRAPGARGTVTLAA
jgi:RNA polymerase sigma factor (sigma-70 family)